MLAKSCNMQYFLEIEQYYYDDDNNLADKG